MALNDIVTLVQRTALDRDTKLQILDLLAVNTEPKLLEDLEQLLRSFDETTKQENAALMTKLQAIDTAHRERVQAIDDDMTHDMQEMEDNIGSSDEIEKIRQSLS